MSLLPLVAKGATVRRQKKILIGPVDLRLEAGGVTIVIGPNGAGKTSLLKMLHGITRLNDGSVTWNCPMDVAQKRQAFVFQQAVMMRRSVVDNVAYPLRLIGMSRREARAEALDWVKRIGLNAAADRSATVLSGGERQKLALARALIRKPEVLFLDEPCASLDGRATREIETLLQDAAEKGTRLVMSTHNLGQAQRLATEIVLVARGQIQEHQSADEFFAEPQTPEGRAFLRGDIIE